MTMIMSPGSVGSPHAPGQDESSAPPSPVPTIDYDRENAFGIHVPSLTFSRFANESGELPEEYQASEEFTTQVGHMCRDAGRQFVDTEQASLEMRETILPPQISTKIANEKEMKAREAELQQREEQRMERVNVLKNILGLVYTWRRPQQLSTNPNIFFAGNTAAANLPEGQSLKPGAVSYLPKFREGIFEDGYFWTAVCMVALWRAPVEHLIASSENRDVGMHTYQFYHIDNADPSIQGWKCITVDDQIPCSADHIPVVGKTMEDNELWSILLEKAYAKFLGSYSMLHTGDTWDAVRHLTGGQCKLLNWDVEQVGTTATCWVWWLVYEHVKQGVMQSVVFLDRDENDRGPGDYVRTLPHWGEEVDGVFNEEEIFYEWNATACTVIGTYEFTGSGPNQGLQLIKLRNAFGGIDWTGEWSDRSDCWTKEIKEQLGFKGPDEYITWMKVDDFVRQFNTHLSCNGFKGCPNSFFEVIRPCAEGSQPFNAHQYLITITDPAAQTIEAGASQTASKSATHKTTGKNATLKLEDEPDEEDQDAEAGAPNSFTAMKAGLDDEGESTGPKYTLQLYVSQPKVDYMSTVPRDLFIGMFKQKVRQLQPCTYAEAEYGYGGDSPAQKFVETNRVELTEKKNKSRFEFTRTISAEPGQYTCTIHQDFYRDEIPYCLAVTAEDDKNLPTGYTMTVEYIGSCAKPQVDKEEKKKRKPAVTTKQQIQAKIEKQKNNM